jgi:excisionase family DNA binding protein
MTETTTPAATAEYLTVREVAGKLRLSMRHVYDLIHEGELESKRFGGALRVTTVSLDEFVARS